MTFARLPIQVISYQIRFRLALVFHLPLGSTMFAIDPA